MTVLPKSMESEIARAAPYDVEAVRADFPILAEEIHGRPLVYLDNGASAQKPKAVLDTIDRAYSHEYANVHRGLHYLSNLSTANFEKARETVRRFLNARSDAEIIFTRNATEAINLVASSYGGVHIGEGDEILLTIMEHHSNIVPWYFLKERHGAVLKWAPVTDTGEFPLDKFEALLGPRTKMVAITQMSNVLGTIVPIKEVVRMAHDRGIPVLVDGAQGAVHLPVDVQDLDCDFYAFTGHKLYGPTGIGVLYGKKELLEAMPPYQGGGEMIGTVTTERITYAAAAASLRGRHPGHRPGHRARRRDRLCRERRPRAHSRPRAEAARLCHGAPWRAQLAPHHRPRQGQGLDHLLRDGGRPSPRCEHHPRPLWRRGQGRNPLRRAASGPLRGDLDSAGLVRHV